MLGNALEEYAFNIFEFEKSRSGSDYFNRSLDADTSSDQRSNFKKANKPAAFEIYVIPEAAHEEEQSASGIVADGKSKDPSSHNTSSDNIISTGLDKARRLFRENKRFRQPESDIGSKSLELSFPREQSDRADKSTVTDHAERDRTGEDKSSNRDDSFKQMIDDQVFKYERKHAKDFFLSKSVRHDKWNFTQDDCQLEDSADAPVKDLSYDFFKEPSSLLEKSKNKTSEFSDLGQGSSEHRTNSHRLTDSDNPRFVDLGKFNSLDTSKNSDSSKVKKPLNTHSVSLGPKPKKEGNLEISDQFDVDLLPIRQSNNDNILINLDPLPMPPKRVTPLRTSKPKTEVDTSVAQEVGQLPPKPQTERPFPESLQYSNVVQKLAVISKSARAQKTIDSVILKTKSGKTQQPFVPSKKKRSTGDANSMLSQREASWTGDSVPKPRNSVRTTDFIQNIKLKLASLKQSVGPTLQVHRGVDPLSSYNQTTVSTKPKGQVSPLNKVNLAKTGDWIDQSERRTSNLLSTTNDMPTIIGGRLNTPHASRKHQLQRPTAEKSLEADTKGRKSINSTLAQVLDSQKLKPDLVSSFLGESEGQGTTPSRRRLPVKNSLKVASAGLSQTKLQRLVAKIAESKVARR